MVSDNCDHGESSEAVGQHVQSVVCDHLYDEVVSLSVTGRREGSEDAPCCLDDVELGQGALVEAHT